VLGIHHKTKVARLISSSVAEIVVAMGSQQTLDPVQTAFLYLEICPSRRYFITSSIHLLMVAMIASTVGGVLPAQILFPMAQQVATTSGKTEATMVALTIATMMLMSLSL